MIKPYVDDLNPALKILRPGTRHNQVENRLDIVEEKVEEDNMKPDDEITIGKLQTQ